jgi:hypothetical protein
MHDYPDICKACGGRCCQGMPGIAFPEDFGLPATEALKAAFASGQWAIDWWEGDPRPDQHQYCQVYFVRPAVKGKEGQLRDPSWGGACTFLTISGCSLEPEKRPRQCRELEPDMTFKCDSHGYGKREAALAWVPYYDILDSIGRSE